VAGAPSHPLGEWYLRRAGKKKKEVFHTLDMTEFHLGDVLITKSTGGSGWGDPLDRGVEKVREAVRDGLISVQKAKEMYGVVMVPESLADPNPENVKVNYEATMQLRKGLKEQERKERDR
jgi:N-methylhydantoinase B